MNLSVNIMKNTGYTKTLPKKFLYLRSLCTLTSPALLDYVMFKPNSKRLAANIVLKKTDKIFRPDYGGKSLVVEYVAAYRHDNGDGTSLINFAKNFSKKNGCNGYLVLDADPSFTPNRVPHIFYRKQGFTTLNEKIDKKMDEFIKENKTATYMDFLSMLMYYPAPDKNIRRKGFLGIYDDLMNIIKYFRT